MPTLRLTVRAAARRGDGKVAVGERDGVGDPSHPQDDQRGKGVNGEEELGRLVPRYQNNETRL